MLVFLNSEKMRKLSILLFISLFSSSCSLFRSPAPSYPSGVMFPLTKSAEVVYKGRIIGLKKGAGEMLLVSTRAGKLYCVDVAKQKIIWTYEVSTGFSSPPFLGKENIYIYDEENILYCLDRGGKQLWMKAIKDRLTSGIVEFKDKIGFGTENGLFLALEAVSGFELWQFQAGDSIRSTPVSAAGRIIFGSDDHNLYILNEEGHLLGKIAVEDKIQATAFIDGKFLYFGADDHYFYCYNWMKNKKKWKVKTGGKIFTPPVSDGKRVLFLCLNNVLYCLNKRNGIILWWKAIPSRSYYQLEVSGNSVVVASLSPLVVSFDIETGEKMGSFDAGQELKSNPIWMKPYLLINLYDYQKDEGILIFLKKKIHVALKPSLSSPQRIGGEITFTASTAGFFKPLHEFYLRRGEKVEAVQEKSEKNTWTWFPEKEGEYMVGVRVFDEKERASTEIPFRIMKD